MNSPLPCPLTPRQRILAAVERRPVDRVPIDLGSTGQSGIAAIAYQKLRVHLGMEPRPARVTDLVQMLADIEPEIADRFGSDTVTVPPATSSFGFLRERWKPFRLADGSYCEVPGDFTPREEADGSLVLSCHGRDVAKMPSGGYYFDSLTKGPGATHPDLSTFHVWEFPGGTIEHMGRECHRLASETDKAVVSWFGPPFELFNGIGQGDFEEWMCTFASEPEYVAELYRMTVDRWIENLQALWRAAGEDLHVLQFCDDLGAQSAPFLSVTMFRDLVMPAYKRGIDWIHENTPWKVLMHTDGAIFPLIPSIIEMGVDALNPIQTTAAGMDLKSLKENFGPRIAFWGASGDSQNNLTSGTPESVAAEVRRHLDILDPLQGGLIFASVHNIQATVPPENIVALFDTALGKSSTNHTH